MKAVNGTAGLNGIAIGPLRLWRRTNAHTVFASSVGPEVELRRFEAARARAEEQLTALGDKALEKVGQDNAAIFEIHRMLLEDEDYLEVVKSIIENRGSTAEYAVTAAGEHFAAIFSAMEDGYMRARSADVKDVSSRMVDILTGTAQGALYGDEPAILVADDLSPSQTIQLDKFKVLGFITRYGSSSSHTAILARTMNIPALMGVDFDDSWDGRMAVLDGVHRQVYLDPDDPLLARMEVRRRADQERQALLLELKGKPTCTLDGREIRLCANIGTADDVEQVLGNDAQGIGLFRSEFLYMEEDRCPTEDQQFEAYKQVVQAMGGKKVVIRTMDIGADKQAAYFHVEKEKNPALGCRGIRCCLKHQDLFKGQLRAILRASAFGTVAVMFPMIIDIREVREAKALLAECRAELEAEGTVVGPLEVGIMVETPAAVMIADELAQEVAFFSIGTNDLAQYTLAIDRQNPQVALLADPHHPAVLRMIRETVEAGHRHGCWVGICGELGADQMLSETFLRMGLDELSVAPADVLPLRQHIRGLDLSGEPRED